ncbi:MAG TPA: aromatic aminobenezylarsenical efflux permease ArsG family transporter [Candidatus Sumerlaeota bacterium]|nr:aromatic aminobenezylarsenical efflux permease ArsG family transporter [Candidatus Sumerlaeota bacterium]
MNAFFVSMATAVWLGIFTSISPCPLATNIAAVSYIGKRLENPFKVFLYGISYTLGRAFAYVLVGVLVVSSLLSAPHLSHFLQKYMNRFLGPLLILVGMVLLEMIPLMPSGSGMTDKLKKRMENWGIAGAFGLGVIFALSFCPISAALFFGSLIPLAVDRESGILMPTLYGIATGLPVLLFALLISFGAKGLMGKVFSNIVRFEKGARMVTGIIFIAAGLYFILAFVFKVL